MDLLLVEDDERVSRFVVRGLEAEGHSVLLSSDGEDGFARATEEHFDLLILDVMLPRKDGHQLCRELREVGVATPIIMLTARDHIEDKVAALRKGADDYMTKPFDFDELLARIEALGRRSRGFPVQAPATVQIDGLLIERDSMRVFYGGELIELTAKEYQLLELFASSPHKVLSRTRILSKIWGYDSDPLTNIVDVYVRRLRAKFGWDPVLGWIRTIRSYGYRFGPQA